MTDNKLDRDKYANLPPEPWDPKGRHFNIDEPLDAEADSDYAYAMAWTPAASVALFLS